MYKSYMKTIYVFSSRNVPPTVARDCARLPRRCTLINMFGIVWSLVEILSHAAGFPPASRCFAITALRAYDVTRLRGDTAPEEALCPRVSRSVPFDETRSEINESQAFLTRTVLTVRRSRGLLQWLATPSAFPFLVSLMICRDFASCSWIILTFRPLCTRFVFQSAKSVVQRGAECLETALQEQLNHQNLFFITRIPFLCS